MHKWTSLNLVGLPINGDLFAVDTGPILWRLLRLVITTGSVHIDGSYSVETTKNFHMNNRYINKQVILRYH